MSSLLEQLAKEFERKTGAPPLSKVTETLEKFPDTKQLRMLKEVLTVANRLSQSAPELDKVAMLIREINSMPMEKLEKLERILKRVEKIIKTAPKDLMEFLSSLKEE